MTHATASAGYGEAAGMDRNRLSRVLQLTGFSDPLYAEAYVTVHAYDVVMDITVTNRTNETLQVGGAGAALDYGIACAALLRLVCLLCPSP